jgi:SH3 domain protein
MRGSLDRRDARCRQHRRGRGLLACAVLAASIAVPSGLAHAESGWVKDELRLNLRSGPGTQYRIIGVIKTGDSAQILSRGDGWTKVRMADADEGWLPAGYLQPEPPARIALSRSQARASELEASLAALTGEAQELRSSNTSLSETDGGQKTEIERLTRENLELRAGARWPEWIAGACLLSAGMIVGAILHRNSGRRPGPRIRL